MDKCVGTTALCARFSSGVRCAVSDGTEFGVPDGWAGPLNDTTADGWGTDVSNYSTIAYPDLDGDGMEDICARFDSGVRCALSDGTTFGDFTGWAGTLNNSTDQGWGTDESNYSTIAYPDLDGNGMADICARFDSGVRCALSDGTTFGDFGGWAGTLNNSTADGWGTDESNYSTIAYPDLNGDDQADICARFDSGVRCALSDGTTFGDFGGWAGTLNNSTADGWGTDESNYSTIAYPDLNGDDQADICARFDSGVRCALSDGTTFGDFDGWAGPLNNTTADGWGTDVSNYSTIAYPDLDNNGMADICARFDSGVRCALSDGTTFGDFGAWAGTLNNSTDQGWGTDESNYSTIGYVDVDSDGLPDICARFDSGVWCGINTGTEFGAFDAWAGTLNNTTDEGWDTDESKYSTISYPNAGPLDCP